MGCWFPVAMRLGYAAVAQPGEPEKFAVLFALNMY